MKVNNKIIIKKIKKKILNSNNYVDLEIPIFATFHIIGKNIGKFDDIFNDNSNSFMDIIMKKSIKMNEYYNSIKTLTINGSPFSFTLYSILGITFFFFSFGSSGFL